MRNRGGHVVGSGRRVTVFFSAIPSRGQAVVGDRADPRPVGIHHVDLLGRERCAVRVGEDDLVALW